MHPGQTGQPVYDMIWQAVKPSTTRTAGIGRDMRIGRFGGRKKCEISYYTTIILDYEPSMTIDVGLNDTR